MNLIDLINEKNDYKEKMKNLQKEIEERCISEFKNSDKKWVRYTIDNKKTISIHEVKYKSQIGKFDKNYITLDRYSLKIDKICIVKDKNENLLIFFPYYYEGFNGNAYPKIFIIPKELAENNKNLDKLLMEVTI